jgi:two-component system response regulator GlrR
LSTGKRTILVVEDDSSIRLVLVEMLRHEGYVVAEADSGTAALELLKSLTVNLVLSDIQMEHGDGFFLLAEIQKLGHHAPPLFFISAHNEISEQDATDRGAKALLRKPLNVDELLAQVEVLLHHEVA